MVVSKKSIIFAVEFKQLIKTIMEEYIRKVEKQYVDGLLENNHETFNYFDINNAFEAGFEISNAMHEKFLNKFLEKIGPFIQGLDADEIYDILQLSKEEAQK